MTRKSYGSMDSRACLSLQIGGSKRHISDHQDRQMELGKAIVPTPDGHMGSISLLTSQDGFRIGKAGFVLELDPWADGSINGVRSKTQTQTQKTQTQKQDANSEWHLNTLNRCPAHV